MSERSLIRHYRATTGTTPARTVERLRVEAARQRLSDTDRSIKEIARSCGCSVGASRRLHHRAPGLLGFREPVAARRRLVIDQRGIVEIVFGPAFAPQGVAALDAGDRADPRSRVRSSAARVRSNCPARRHTVSITSWVRSSATGALAPRRRR